MCAVESSWSPGEIPPDLIERLKNCQKPLILTHIYPDGDALGSAVGMHRALQQLGAHPRTILTHPVPEKLFFIDHDNLAEVLSESSDLQPESLVAEADLIIVVDTSAPERLGLLESAVSASEVPRVCIDHHLEGSLDYFASVWCEPASPATGNLVFELISALGLQHDKNTAETLFVSLATDTGWFRHSNAGFQAWKYAAEMVSLGVDPEPIYNRIFQSFSHERTRSLGDLLSKSVLCQGGKVLYSVFTEEIRSQHRVNMEDLDGFVDSLGQVKGTEIVFLVVEVGPERFKVSLRSRGDYSVHGVAAQFGGGGHAKAAGCRLNGSEEDVIRQLLAACQSLLEGDFDPAAQVDETPR